MFMYLSRCVKYFCGSNIYIYHHRGLRITHYMAPLRMQRIRTQGKKTGEMLRAHARLCNIYSRIYLFQRITIERNFCVTLYAYRLTRVSWLVDEPK